METRFSKRISNYMLYQNRKTHLPPILVISFAVYIFYWSVVSILKFNSLHASVYDLGLSYINMWGVTHNSWSFHDFLVKVIQQGGVFIVFPLQYGGYYAMLIFQTIFLGIGSIFIYLIGKTITENDRMSSLISVSYLLYFPLYGLNWFDFHFQSLFPTFFLIGYYLYLRGNLKTSSIVLFVSGLMRFPYLIFPLLFWVVSYFTDKTHFSDRKSKSLALANILVLSLFLIIGYLVLGSSNIQTHITSQIDPSIGLENKVITLLVILGPLFFMPVFTKKWALFIMPFVILMFFSNNPVYQFPYLFQLQYPASFVAFVYIGIIEFVSGRRVTRKVSGHSTLKLFKSGKNQFETIQKRLSGHRLTLIKTSLIVLLVISIGYQFMLPLQQSNISIGNLVTSNNNVSLNSQLREISYLIPSGDENILLQNNLPQFLEYHPQSNVTVPGFVGPLITSTDIRNNSFPFFIPGESATIKIDYVVANPVDLSEYQSSVNPGFPSMEEIVNQLLHSGYYGIKAQTSSFLVLQRNYTGPSIMIGGHPDNLAGSVSSFNVSFETQMAAVDSMENYHVLHSNNPMFMPENFAPLLKFNKQTNILGWQFLS